MEKKYRKYQILEKPKKQDIKTVEIERYYVKKPLFL